MKWYSTGIIVSVIFLIVHGVVAESLISFNQEIKPDSDATDDLISNAGILHIPAGMGFMTTKEIIHPYWDPNGKILPVRVDLSPVNATGPFADLEIVGIDFYQSGNKLYGFSFSNGIPLTIVTKYYVNSTTSIPYSLLVQKTFDTGNSIPDYNLIYTADYEPLPVNLSAHNSSYPSGLYTTNGGELNLTRSTDKTDIHPFIRGFFTNGTKLEGGLEGPVWSGIWSSNETEAKINPYKSKFGQFLIIFDNTWSSFNGTIGNHLSCSDGGLLTGTRAT